MSGILAEIADIQAVRITCGKCGVAASFPLVSFSNAPLSCGTCKESWFPRDSADRDGILKLMDGLSTLKRGKDATSLIQIELPAPK
jgi:hypothetical protein